MTNNTQIYATFSKAINVFVVKSNRWMTDNDNKQHTKDTMGQNKMSIARITTIRRNTSHTRKEMFYLTTHSTHFIYGYMASDIMVKDHSDSEKETRCRHMGYSFRLAARVLLYASSHRQDYYTYHCLC